MTERHRGRLAGGLASVALVMATAACTINLTIPGRSQEPGGTPPQHSATPTEPAPTTPSTAELQRTVVRITQLNENGRTCTWGSGAIVDPAGLILTNFHVVRILPACPYEALGVELTDDPESPPELRYFARVVAYDERLDLAVLRITGGVDGAPLPTGLPVLTVGDSDAVAIGDPLTILGFPSLGGETVTVTTGTVSGFRSDEGIDRGWFKTDATVTGGNSGGGAVNSNGELVAVPTEASTGVFGEAADCRPSRDTNGDGEIDDADDCTPIGGFLTLLRPVALARDLLELAPLADPVPIDELWPAGQTPETSGPASDVPLITNPRFGSGLSGGALVGEGLWLPTGADQVCVMLDFEGMSDGDVWRYAWHHDGSEVVSETRDGLVWDDGAYATTSLCAGVANGSGVKDGLWEVRVDVARPDGVHSVAYSVLTGDRHASVELTVEVARDDLCALDARPKYARDWHTVARSDSWADGDSFTVPLAAGTYDLRAIDCGDETIGYALDTQITAETRLRVG